MYKQVLLQFGDIAPVLQNTADIVLPTRAKLLPFFSNNQKNIALQLELAAIIDIGEPFVKVTYRLEGDGSLAQEAITHVVTQRNKTVRQQVADNGKKVCTTRA